MRGDQRITGMTSGQAKLLLVGPAYDFKRYGQCGAEITEMMPHIGSIADDIAIVRSMHTDPINHDPAVTYLLTGNQQPGRPTDRLVDRLWPGQREQEPARVRGAALWRRRSTAVGRAIGATVSCPASLPGRAVSLDRRSGAVRVESRRDRPGRPPRDCSTACSS